MMMTINFGASKREPEAEDETGKKLKKAALQRRMQGLKDPDEDKKKTQVSSFGGSK